MEITRYENELLRAHLATELEKLKAENQELKMKLQLYETNAILSNPTQTPSADRTASVTEIPQTPSATEIPSVTQTPSAPQTPSAVPPTLLIHP